LNDLESSLKDLNEAIARDPQNLSSLQQRSIIRNRLGDLTGSHADFLAGLSLDPSSRERTDIQAFLAYRTGEYRTAMTLCESLLEAESKNHFALNLLAWLLATCPDDAIRNGPRAVQLAQAACELSSFADSNDLETLAAACAECGDFPAAIRWQQQALQHFAPAEAQAWGFLLELYETGQPYRQHPIATENPPQELRAADETLPS
jgi:serine/threonine-protein kinase